MNRVNSAVFHSKDREITLIDKGDSLINRFFSQFVLKYLIFRRLYLIIGAST